MKLECSRKDLVDAIDFVAPVSSTRSPNPLFQSIRLEAEGSSLKALACDGEMWAERAVMAAVEEPGSLCVQGRVIKELVASLPDGPVTFETVPGAIIVRSGASNWRLMAYPSDDFPLIPTFQSESSLKLKFSELMDAIEGVSYAVASDSARAVLTGVLFFYNGTELTLVATDTHRLAVLKLPKEGIGTNVRAVVPEKALHAVKALPLDAADEITLEFDEERLFVDSGGARVASQLLAGTYPNWDRVVPEQHTRSWTLDRAELIENLKRIRILSRDSSNRVCFGGDGDHVQLSARSEEKGEAKEEVTVVNNNGDIQIAFNGQYVLEALQAFKSDSVAAELTEPSRPAVFRPNGEEGAQKFCVIMPMALG